MNKRLFEIICSKNENQAKNAAKKLIDNADLSEFEALCNKMEYLFDFVKENIYKRFKFVINQNNYKNIFKFFDFYSFYFDDFFSSILAEYANEDLTDEILEILNSGTDRQKAYAAKYFSKIPDTVAIDDLRKNSKTDFEPLFENCAEALGKMNDTETFNKYLSSLKSEDDFEVLKAVKFFVAFGNKNIINDLINTMNNSKMSENIAGEIVYLVSPLELLEKDFKNGILLINNLINGLGEILPLENVFNYEVYEIADFLIDNSKNQESAVILFNLKNKFNTLTQNEEYIFDLDKNTKNEIFEIKNLLFSQNKDFWNKEKTLLSSAISVDNPLLHTILEIIKENKFKEFLPQLISLAKSENEIIAFEAILVIKELGEIHNLKKDEIILKNENLKAAFEQIIK